MSFIFNYIGEWDAKNNIPYLTDGVGTDGDTYNIFNGGSQNLGHGTILYMQLQSVVYKNGIWNQLSLVYTFSPNGGGGGGSGVTAVLTTGPITGGPITSTGTIGITKADTSTDGYISAADWNTFNGKGSGTVTAISVASANGFAGSSSGGATPAITLSTSITGVLKGNGTAISAATDTDINSKLLTGYVSGAGTVAATDSILQGIQKLNGNITALVTGVSSVSGTTNRITASPTTGAVIVDISATFEALLGKVANPLSQFAATTSAQLAGVISDETGSGVLCFATSPTFTTSIIMADAANVVINTTTGTKIGTSTTQKLAFYNSTPIVQPTGDVITALQNLGLVASATITATTNANLTGPITSVGNATSIASQTGTGSKFMVDTDPALTVSSPTTTSVGYLGIPQNSKSAAYTTIMTDAGKHIYHPSSDTTARTWTIDSNANVAYPIGTTLTFVNDTSAGTITLAITSDTLVWFPTGGTGSRTIAASGVATALKVTSTRWVLTGVGIT
jgi:hypothetical protein